MPRIEFVKDELYEHLGRNKGHTFYAAEQYDFTQSFADRWTHRGLAEEIGASKTPEVDRQGPFVPVKGTSRQPAMAPDKALAAAQPAPRASRTNARPEKPAKTEAAPVALAAALTDANLTLKRNDDAANATGGQGTPAPQSEKTPGVFVAGDVVRLKSGGPDMTVLDFAADGKVRASWDNGDGTTGEDAFANDSLEHVTAAV